MLIFTRNSSGSTWEANCDACPAAVDLDTGSFNRAKEHLKARGWQTAPKPGGRPGTPIMWQDFCPSCAKEKSEDIKMARYTLRFRSRG
jgi:hypothetical protein